MEGLRKEPLLTGSTVASTNNINRPDNEMGWLVYIICNKKFLY